MLPIGIFSDAAENYRIEAQKFLNDDFAQNSTYGNWGYKADAETWAKLPKFSYTPPQLSRILNDNQGYFLILGIWVSPFVYCFIR